MELTLQEVEPQLTQAYQTCAILEEFLYSPEALKPENRLRMLRMKDYLEGTIQLIEAAEIVREDLENKVFNLERLLCTQ